MRAKDYRLKSKKKIVLQDGTELTVRKMLPWDFEKFGVIPENFKDALAGGEAVKVDNLKTEDIEFFNELLKYILLKCVEPSEEFVIVDKEEVDCTDAEIPYKMLELSDQLTIMNGVFEISFGKKGVPGEKPGPKSDGQGTAS